MKNIAYREPYGRTGNPGLVDFYIPFLSEIHGSQVSSSLAVVAQAHLDHYPGIHNDAHARYRPEESLTIQIQNSLDLLEAIDAYYARKPRIIVVGHSVGCWISLQVGYYHLVFRANHGLM